MLSTMRSSVGALLSVIALVLAADACSRPQTKTDYTVKLCIDPSSWGEVGKAMRGFGSHYRLDFHGEIAPLSQTKSRAKLHDQLNYALIRGLR